MGAQQGKERERTTTSTAGSLHSLTLASQTGSRPVKPKTNSLRPARDNSSASRSQAFNVFVEHNGMSAVLSKQFSSRQPDMSVSDCRSFGAIRSCLIIVGAPSCNTTLRLKEFESTLAVSLCPLVNRPWESWQPTFFGRSCLRLYIQ